MNIQRIDPPCDPIDLENNNQAFLSDEWAITQALQGWCLPLYTATLDQAAEEEYQLVQDMLLLAGLVLALG